MEINFINYFVEQPPSGDTSAVGAINSAPTDVRIIC
jgi:hypothetical protein